MVTDRAEFEAAWQQHGEINRQQTFAPHYAGSSVIAGPPGAVCGAQSSHSFAAQPGHHLTLQVLSASRNVFEVLGTGFTLLAFDAADAVIAFEQAAKAACP